MMKKLSILLFIFMLFTACQANTSNPPVQAAVPSMAGMADEGVFELYRNNELAATTTFQWQADGSYESGVTEVQKNKNVYSAIKIKVDETGQWSSIQRESPQGLQTFLRNESSAIIRTGTIPCVSRNPALLSLIIRAYDQAKTGQQTFRQFVIPDIDAIEIRITRLDPVEGPVKGRLLKLTPYVLNDADGKNTFYADADSRIILYEIPYEHKIYVRQGYEELLTLNVTSLAAKADARLSRWFEPNQPGAAILLMQDGKVLFKKGYGLANVEHNVPMQPDMVFRIGSVTKQFTAVAIMLLVEEGKVDLQAPIFRYLENLPKAWEAVTVEQLLNHTSSIFDYSNTDNFWEHMHENLTPTELLELYVSKLPLDFEPGTKFRYTNTGYILLGMIIEKISGQSYARFLQKRIFEPLNLKHTRYDSETDHIPGMVSGYTIGTRLAYFCSVTQKYAAFGLVSNTEDLARWTLALHSGKVVKPESLARMLMPTRLRNGEKLDYGFGLGLQQSQWNRLVGHKGKTSGFTCDIEADPAAKAVTVILNNTDYPKWDREDITRYLLSLVALKPHLKLIPVATEPSKLKRLIGRYTFGALTRTIIFDGRDLYNQSEGDIKRMLIPLSETEFGYDDYEDVAMRLRFELAGDKVMGVHCRRADDILEEPLQKHVEPIEDKNPEVTALVQQLIREAIDGTLKPDLFTPNLAAKIFPDQLNKAAALFKSLGSQTGIEQYELDQMPGSSVCRYLYRLGYGDKHVILRLSLLEDKRISNIDFSLE
jgi:serine beta-lactamase-like protein LACTB